MGKKSVRNTVGVTGGLLLLAELSGLGELDCSAVYRHSVFRLTLENRHRRAAGNSAADHFTFQSFLPSFDSQGLSYVIVILFDLMGFEVITTYTDDMEKPDTQLPRAIKLGGIFIVFFYILAAFGISVAIPVDKLSASTGVIESFRILLHRTDGILISLIAVMFLYALFANLISWSLGVNYVLKSAAQDRCLPKMLAVETRKNSMPLGAAVANGMISSTIVLRVR